MNEIWHLQVKLLACYVTANVTLDYVRVTKAILINTTMSYINIVCQQSVWETFFFLSSLAFPSLTRIFKYYSCFILLRPNTRKSCQH